MSPRVKKRIIEEAKSWMRDELVPAHKSNTLKLAEPKEITINPFLWAYLAQYLEGDNRYTSLAKVLIYPRALGTSINTSFGQRSQQLITRMFSDTFGSAISGIDIEFVDKLDGRKKYAQVKAGPNVINSDDVITIREHFRTAINQARTNQLDLRHDDLVFCLLYGEPGQENQFVRTLQEDYIVIMGKDFWHRFTGDEKFYADLTRAMGEVASEVNMKEEIEKLVKELAKNLKNEYPNISSV
jgi:type II restriction endonuclease EcoO109I-like protein